ncbi:MAG: homocysteine S-methyltransferase family protein [Clostridiales bacterium]|jgi:5-methyltetrahydrofolate--homocysteine methyltransferase|nr:homocysteine S-methyltransferase family protein [Clostridiales bacterium]
MDLKEFISKKEFVLLDGAFGTNVLKKYPDNYDAIELFNFKDEELVFNIHKSYADAGSDIIVANTFSANAFKLKPKGYSVDGVVKKALSIARRAGAKYVGLDIGPLGRLLEPLGNMTYDEAYEAFAEIVSAGVKYGADLIYFETFSDLAELKTGVLAAKENSDLPVFATMTFESNNKTFIGVSAAAAAVTLEGLGVDAFGLNCSSGPRAMLPIVEEIAAHINIPIIAKANAGIPRFIDGKSVYDMPPEEFAADVGLLIDAGACFVGGCCGTDDAYIRELKKLLETKKRAKKERIKKTFLASQGRVFCIDDNFAVIGERLNPTGKPALKKALIEKNSEFLVAEARAQLEAGADVLDINCGIFEVNETETLSFVVGEFNGVIDAPFCLDSSEPKALDAAVRRTSGLPLVNSVNGKTKNLEAVLPIVKKYGTPVICLLLDEKGIPKTVEDRIAIAEKIISYAEKYGVGREKLVFDCLTLTVSAEQENVVNTLKAVKIISERFGCNTVLGLSNVSFGLPARELINSAFLSHALAHGLTSAILNPMNYEVTAAIDSYRVLYNKDKNAEKYIEKYKNAPKNSARNLNFAETKNGGIEAMTNAINSEKKSGERHPIVEAIVKGRREETKTLSYEKLKEEDGLTLINKYLIPALDEVGLMYEKGRIFLPELLMSANAAKAAFDAVKEKSPKAAETKGTVLLATVFGDVHDIGKNIAKMLLNNYGYDVIDLGKDVPVDLILKTIGENDIKLVGLSALMTTTLNNMRDTIVEIRKISDAKIMVGGAVVTKENSGLIGADYYCKDAIDGVSVAKKLL